MVFVKTGTNELTCSEVHDVRDTDLTQVLAGLSFAAYDGRVREYALDHPIVNKIVQNHLDCYGYTKIAVDPVGSANNQMLIDYLAGDRVPAW